MANPEHVKIIKAGREALEKWWGGPWQEEKYRGYLTPQGSKTHIRPTKETVLDLRGANLEGLMLNDLCLWGADLQGARLLNVNLSGSDLSFANLTRSGLLQAYLEGTNFSFAVLEKANLNRSDLTCATLGGANLRGASLFGARLMNAKLWEADLSGADITMAQFAEADLSKAKLDGIQMLHTGTDGWIIKDVHCTHFKIGLYEKTTRVPKRGYLAPGEFEDRFKSRPTIEFMFDDGMPALGPAILALAIDQANSKRPGTGLRLLDITARGGLPRAIIEIAEKIPKAVALKLVSSCYQQTVAQMQKEIAGLKDDKQTLLQITSQKMLLPAMKSEGDSWITITEAAKLLVANPGVISRWANQGKIKDNGKTKRARRVLKSSVLLMKQKKEDAELLEDAKELRKDSKDFR